MTGECNLPGYQGSHFQGPVRTVRVEVKPKSDLTPERVDAILAALRPADDPDAYFFNQPDPGPDRDNQLIHKLLCWHYEEYDTYEETAERVRGIVKLLNEEGRIAHLDPEIEQVIEMIRRMDPPDRLRVVRHFCNHCGDEDSHCPCQDDEREPATG